MTQKLQSHEYANIFPILNETDARQLAESIKENGLLQPVILYEGRLLDGRNRYAACLAAG